VLLVEPRLRGAYSDTYTASYGVLTGVHFDQIDRPAPERYNERSAVAFEHYFQTRPVLDTMLDLDRALA
jgi:hypothetical protein